MCRSRSTVPPLNRSTAPQFYGFLDPPEDDEDDEDDEAAGAERALSAGCDAPLEERGAS